MVFSKGFSWCLVLWSPLNQALRWLGPNWLDTLTPEDTKTTISKVMSQILDNWQKPETHEVQMQMQSFWTEKLHHTFSQIWMFHHQQHCPSITNFSYFICWGCLLIEWELALIQLFLQVSVKVNSFNYISLFRLFK